MKSIEEIKNWLEEVIKEQVSLVAEYPEVPEWECQDDEESALTLHEYRQGWIDALEWVKEEAIQK